MGQRSQVFLYCINPCNGLKDQFKSLQKYGRDKNELELLKSKIEKYEQAFGTKPHTVISFHHQWLYGRASLLACSRIIEFNKFCEKESNPLKSQTEISGDEYLNFLINLLGIFNSKLAKAIGRFGIEHFRLLNFIDPDMRTDCTRGDNNDGIFVIDCMNDSYCFTSVLSGDATISQLSPMVPVTAGRYVRLYYPEQQTDSNTANVPEGIEEQKAYFTNNRRMNNLFTKPFNDYRLMTKSELKKLFPASFQTQTPESNPVQSDNNQI